MTCRLSHYDLICNKYNFPGPIKYHATCLVLLIILWRSSRRSFNAIVYVALTVGSSRVILSRGLISLTSKVNYLSRITYEL